MPLAENPPNCITCQVSTTLPLHPHPCALDPHPNPWNLSPNTLRRRSGVWTSMRSLLIATSRLLIVTSRFVYSTLLYRDNPTQINLSKPEQPQKKWCLRRETGIVLPNNQCQRRTSHAPKDVRTCCPYAYVLITVLHVSPRNKWCLDLSLSPLDSCPDLEKGVGALSAASLSSSISSWFRPTMSLTVQFCLIMVGLIVGHAKLVRPGSFPLQS